jgi:hypothetical protein
MQCGGLLPAASHSFRVTVHGGIRQKRRNCGQQYELPFRHCRLATPFVRCGIHLLGEPNPVPCG